MSSGNGDDVEALLSTWNEITALKWGFIRRVYAIVIVQLIATIAVAAAVAFVPSIFSFFSNPWAGWGFFILLVIVLTIVIIALVYMREWHPYNLILLGIFSLCLGLVLGLATTFIKGIIIVEAGIVIIVVMLGLLAYSFWASWRGHDFGFLAPFLLNIVLIVASFTLLKIYFPSGHVSDAIYSGIVVLFLCTFIIVDTDALITIIPMYHEYIIASITIYLGIFNIFSRLLGLIKLIIACWAASRD